MCQHQDSRLSSPHTGAMISPCTHPVHQSSSQQRCQSSRRRCPRGPACQVQLEACACSFAAMSEQQQAASPGSCKQQIPHNKVAHHWHAPHVPHAGYLLSSCLLPAVTALVLQDCGSKLSMDVGRDYILVLLDTECGVFWHVVSVCSCRTPA
jgi:hypothetical protein